MKKILLIFTLLLVKTANAQGMPDRIKVLTFDSVNLDKKIITLSGKKYHYLMDDKENSFINNTFQYKKLNHLQKGEKIFAKFSLKENDSRKYGKYLVVYIGKNMGAF